MILNLTQHAATPEQVAAGVVDANPELLEQLQKLLTFETLPEGFEVKFRAEDIAELAVEWAKAQGTQNAGSEHFSGRTPTGPRTMIGGAPFLMAELEQALVLQNIRPVFAFSQRVSVEVKTESGVVKTSEFRHLGFVAG